MAFLGKKKSGLNVANLMVGDVVLAKDGGKYIILEIDGKECYCYSLAHSGETVQCIYKDDVQRYLGNVKAYIDKAVAWCRANY